MCGLPIHPFLIKNFWNSDDFAGDAHPGEPKSIRRKISDRYVRDETLAKHLAIDHSAIRDSDEAITHHFFDTLGRWTKQFQLPHMHGEVAKRTDVATRHNRARSLLKGLDTPLDIVGQQEI